MSIGLFTQDLASFPAARARELDQRFGVEAVYALVWPNYEPPIAPIPQSNREAFENWRLEARVPLWAWIVCSTDQAADAASIAALTNELEPHGWMLNIEKPLEGAKLETVVKAAAGTGLPVRASLAGASPALAEYDYRTLDRYGVAVDWQAYFDSGEGPPPASAVRELYQSSFVVAGWQYRHRVGDRYGWGRVKLVQHEELAVFDSYLRPGDDDSVFGVLPREFGWEVDDRILWPANPDRPPLGVMMGRAAYPRIRVTLDVTRSAQGRPPELWTAIAASARVQGAKKRGISVYLAESGSDETLAAIAEGAAP